MFLCLALPSKADWDPGLHFHTLVTKHCRIHYYDGEAKVAQQVAALAETVLKRVSRFLHLNPPKTIHILVTDTTDSANGSARVFPYPLVVVQPYPPPSFGQLSNFEDYLQVLLTHEFTHIVHMNTKRGVPAFFNRFFGNLLFPNYAHPALLLEGLAVLSESRLNRGGRLNSPYFEMILRAERKAHNIPPLSKVTMSPLRLPRGTSPYLFGSYFMDYLARHFGVKAISDYFKAYGGLLIPFAHNIIARRIFHRSLVDLYRTFLKELRKRLDKAIRAIQKQGLTHLTWLTKNGEFHADPVQIPGKNVCFIENDAKTREAIFCIDSRGHRRKVITCFGGCGGLSWSRTLGGILTTHAVPFKNVMSYSDIFVVHTNGTETRITRGARAMSPAEFGRGIVFVRAVPGGNKLSYFDLQTKKVRNLIPDGAFDSISDVTVNKDTVYFSATSKGNWDIYSWSKARGITRITTGPWIDIMPRVSPSDGSLYYISTRNGVYNVYRIRPNQTKTCRITNVIGGVFRPFPTMNRLLLMVYTNRGFDIAATDLAESENRSCYPLSQPQKFNPVFDQKPQLFKPINYNPLKSMTPRYLRPIFTVSGTNVQNLGLFTELQDATGLHTVDIQLDTDITHPYPSFDAAYTFGGWWANIGVYGSISNAFYMARPGRQTVITGGKHGSVGMFIGLPVRFRDHYIGITVNTAVEFLRPDRVRNPDFDPIFMPIFANDATTIDTRISLNYISATYYPYSIAPQDGWLSGFSTGIRAQPDTGDWALTFTGYITAFITPFWSKSHSLEISVYGGASRGAPELRSMFTMGGPVSVNPLEALLNQTTMSRPLMRGFESGSLIGDTFWAGTLQYNMPIFRIDRGLGSLPLYFRYLAGDVFVDTGSAFFDGMAPGPPKWSAGAEVWLTLAPALLDNFKLLLGFAYAQKPVVYFTVGY